jgi:hypothetical protein
MEAGYCGTDNRIALLPPESMRSKQRHYRYEVSKLVYSNIILR